MNTYLPNLFDIWPGDEALTELPTAPRVVSLFPGVYDLTTQDLPWLVTMVKTIKQQDEDDIFDLLYRRSHILYGFATILALPKVTHLLALLDFTCNYARDIETFEQHSMDYVVHLLVTMTQEVLADFHAHGHCQRDLREVLEECRTYLHPLFQQWCRAPLAAEDAPQAPRDGSRVRHRAMQLVVVKMLVGVDTDDEGAVGCQRCRCCSREPAK